MKYLIILSLIILAYGCQEKSLEYNKDEHNCILSLGQKWCEDESICKLEDETCADSVDNSDNETNNQIIGGDKDDYGCLIGAGYSWNDDIGACIREWELDENQRKAAKMVIAPMSARPITIVEVLTMGCPGCFDVKIRNGDRITTITLNDWEIVFDKGDIVDFESCVAAGNPIMESYPRKCAADGKTYIEVIENKPIYCKEEQRNVQICTMDYTPVCSNFGQNIQCIRAPCGQTYSNACSACSNPDVESYTMGECE